MLTKLYSICITLVLLPIAISGRAQAPVFECLLAQTTECVAFNPLSRGQVVYAAYDSLVGTQYLVVIARSDNGGASWSNRFLPADEYSVHQILCVPSDTSLLFAVGKQKLFKSTDGGSHWGVSLDTGSYDGETLVYVEATHTLFFARNAGGPLYISVDSGMTWVIQYMDAPYYALCSVAASPRTNTLLAGGGNGVIIRSADGGITWNPVVPADPNDSVAEITNIQYDVNNPNVALASVFQYQHETMLRTTDDGVSWIRLPVDSVLTWAFAMDERSSASVHGIPQRLWVGLLDVYDYISPVNYPALRESSDGGVTWTGMSVHSNGATANKINCIKFDTSSGVLLLATEQGLFKTVNDPVFVEGHHDKQSTEFSFSNNPMAESTILRWSSKLGVREVRAISVLGQTVLRLEVQGKSELKISNTELPAGLWTLHGISSDGMILTAKLLVE